MITCLTLSAFGDQNYPKGIKEILFVQSFYDGGSTIIEFIDEAGVEWRLLHNRSIEALKEEYDKVCLGTVPLYEDSIDPIVPQTLENEKKLLDMVKQYFDKMSDSEDPDYQIIKTFLIKKDIIPTRPSRGIPTRSAPRNPSR